MVERVDGEKQETVPRGSHPYLYHQLILPSQPIDLTMQPHGTKQTQPGFLASKEDKAIVLHLTTVGLSARYTLIHNSVPDSKGVPRSPVAEHLTTRSQTIRPCWKALECKVAPFSSHLGPWKAMQKKK
jgi:hypothetical protein